MLGSLISNIPLVGSVYGLGKTSLEVYSASSPTEAIKTGLIGVFVNCTPPAIKYPILCAHLAGCAAVTVSTGGNPIAVASTLNAARLIIDAD
jgi:hypothetical protein